jgi:hypothetical protein
MNRLKTLMAVVAMMGAAGAVALAQEQPDMRSMATGMRKNQEELQKYTWESKVSFEVDGVQRRLDTYTVRYVMGGAMQKMQTSSDVAKGKVRRPDGSKFKKKELEAAREFVLEANRQLDNYLNPLFAEKAVASATVMTNDETLLLLSRDVITTGDTVEIELVRSSWRPLSAKITTSIGDSPVALDVTFGSIDYGPNHPARSVTTTEWQGMKLTITTENSNYVEQGR